MPLSLAPLKSDLQASMEGYPASAAVAAQGWANAITSHVATGLSPQSVPPTPASIAAGLSALASGISSAFQSGSASGAAGGVAGAVVTFYWGLLFDGVTPGTVTAIGGSGALGTALAAAFNDNTSSSATMSEAATRFANAIHACAQSVIITHVPPAYVVGPLT